MTRVLRVVRVLRVRSEGGTAYCHQHHRNAEPGENALHVLIPLIDWPRGAGRSPQSALPVLTAISDPSVEAALVAAFGNEALGVAVTRRCVDLADLLATAAAGTGRAVLVSADLRGLDQGDVAGVQRAGLAVVGLAPRAVSRPSDGRSRSVWTRCCPWTPR